MNNRSGVFVGLRNDGRVAIVGRGLPVLLNDEQAKDVIGGICVVKGWVVLPETDSDGGAGVRVFPRDDAMPCELTAIREVVDEYDRQLREPGSVRGAVRVTLTGLVRGLVDHAMLRYRRAATEAQSADALTSQDEQR